MSNNSLTLKAKEYAVLLKRRAKRVSKMLRVEGFSHGFHYSEEVVDESIEALEEILKDIKTKRKA